MATLTIHGNTFTPRSPSVSIVGQVNAEQVTFVVDESWSDLELQAQFSNTSIDREPVPVALDETMTCFVPSEATEQPGKVYVALAGYDDGVQIKLTELLHYSNAKTGADPSGGIPPEEQTPSYLNQIKQILNETKEVAQSVRTDANNGLFDGEPGKSPIIKNGNWWIWDVESQEYRDTGVAASGGGGGGVSSYNDLSDRPRIGGVLLEGNKTAQDLGLQPKGDYATTSSKLANPFSLTFTGAVEATYDGSQAVTVTIPTIAGPPGVSPTVSTEEIDGGTRVTFTFQGGSETVDLLNGKDGKTPVKGIDYGTEQDIQEIAKKAAALVPSGGKVERTLLSETTDKEVAAFSVTEGLEGIKTIRAVLGTPSVEKNSIYLKIIFYLSGKQYLVLPFAAAPNTQPTQISIKLTITDSGIAELNISGGRNQSDLSTPQVYNPLGNVANVFSQFKIAKNCKIDRFAIQAYDTVFPNGTNILIEGEG